MSKSDSIFLYNQYAVNIHFSNNKKTLVKKFITYRNLSNNVYSFGEHLNN